MPPSTNAKLRRLTTAKNTLAPYKKMITFMNALKKRFGEKLNLREARSLSECSKMVNGIVIFLDKNVFPDLARMNFKIRLAEEVV